MKRSFALLPLLLVALFADAQATVVLQGKPFNKALKGSTGDLFTVVCGSFAKDGRHMLYVEEGLTPKVVRLDAQLVPSEELVLKDFVIDGVKWTGVTGIIDNGALRCLLVSNGKKSAEYGIGTVNTAGPLAITGFRKLATFDLNYTNDPAFTMVSRPLPDPILFTRGLAYVQRERLIASPDGNRYLLNHFTNEAKGDKLFQFAILDKDFTVLSNGSATLPYEDAKSSIHQILFSNDEVVRLLTYVFQCKSEEQLGDKNCHELHLTTVEDGGKTVSDILVEKNFISSARLCERGGDRLAIALRYGSLTGTPGVVVTFDPKDPKLKPTPLATQRLPSIHKAKLMAYGDPSADPKKTVSRTAKVPDEIVDLAPAWDGGLLVLETFLETMFQLPMGEAIAIRHLSGPVRATYVQANDSIGWQTTVDRALMTTAGQLYEGCSWTTTDKGPLIFHGQTPRGFEAILRSGVEAGTQKGALPAEPQVLRAALFSHTGEVLANGLVLGMEETFIPSPNVVVFEKDGTRALVKSYDRGSQYRFTVVDLAKLGQ